MTITQLKYFLKLTESMNFSQAANQLYISQSSLSQHIIKLEKELGVTLFERRYGGLVLTPEGERLEEIGRRITGDIGNIKNYVNASPEAAERTLLVPEQFFVAMDERTFYGNFDLTRAFVASLRAVGERYVGTNIITRQIDLPEKILSRISDREVDVCLGAVKPEETIGLEFRQIAEQQVNLVVRRQEKWKGVMPSFSEVLEFLNSTSIYTVNFDRSHVERVNRWLADYGIRKQVGFVEDGWFLQLELQMRNIAAFIPTHALQNEFGGQDLFVLPIHELTIPRYMVWRSDNGSPVLQTFLDNFLRHLQNRDQIVHKSQLGLAPAAEA